MNAVKNLSTLIDALEKIASLPTQEILDNPQLQKDIRKALSVTNIEGMINQFMSDAIDQSQQRQYDTKSDVNKLLHLYARRESERMIGVVPTVYETKVVEDGFKADMTAVTKNVKGIEPSLDKEFASAYNAIYADGAVKINTAGDPALLGSYIDYTPYRANMAEYLAVPTLSEMVDKPLALALKKMPKIVSQNKILVERVEKFFKRVQMRSVLKDAMFYSLLSPRGSLTVPIKRSGKITFNVFNDTQFSYGAGKSFSGITQQYDPTRVGALYCMGAQLRHGVSAFFLCPGYDPLFGVGLNRVPQLRSAAEAWNLYVHVLKILLVRSQVIIEKMEGDIQTDTMLSKMRSQLQRLSQTMGVSTPIEQPRGMALDIMTNNIGPGTADIASVFKEFVGSVTGVAPEYFFGGGNSNYSQAAFQIASTNENINSRYQESQIEPILRFAINTAIAEDSEFANIGAAENDFEIEFESIYDETEAEKAELANKRTDTLIRQRDFPELEEAYKKLGLLRDDISFKGLAPDHNEDDNEDPKDGNPGPGETEKSVLSNPLT
jgi:hypothetical protein